MGSENARIVSEYAGGWTNGNEYKLLNSMAWASFDPPSGPKGEKACQVFMSAQAISTKAFGQHMPDLPSRDRKPFYGADEADSKAYKSANNRITAARSALVKLGVLIEIRKASNWNPGQYELDLDRVKQLGTAHFERSSAEHDRRRDSMKTVEHHSKETVEQETFRESVIHENHGMHSKETVEQIGSIPKETVSAFQENRGH